MSHQTSHVSHVPGVLQCLVQLGLAKLSLAVLGFGRTLKRYEGIPVSRNELQVVDDDRIEVIGESVAAAAALYPGRARCLEQSLVLHRALRRSGVNSRLRLGVIPYPFAGHAWVECEGRPVNEFADQIHRLTPLEG